MAQQTFAQVQTQEPGCWNQQVQYLLPTSGSNHPHYAAIHQFYNGASTMTTSSMGKSGFTGLSNTPSSSRTSMFYAALTSSSSSASHYGIDEEKENLGLKRRNQADKFKTSLCKHFSSKGQCSLGERCQFAHGVHELRPFSTNTSRQTPPTVPSPNTSASFKIELCQSFKKTGSGVCSYGSRCRFIHPEDSLYAYKKKQEKHEDEVQALHMLKESAYGNQLLQLQLEATINQKVRQWNQQNPKKAHYHDLHGMTLDGADKYIHDIITSMIYNNIPKSFIETGKGNHSSGGFSKIKSLIAEKYQGYYGANFVPEQNNDGVLVLTIPL